jgi:phosphoketolase
MDAAIKHCTYGIGIWEWASNDKGSGEKRQIVDQELHVLLL